MVPPLQCNNSNLTASSAYPCLPIEPTWHYCCCADRCQAFWNTLGTCDEPHGVNTDFTDFWFHTKFDNKIKPLPRTVVFTAFYSLDPAPSNGVSMYSTCLIDSRQCRVDVSRLSFSGWPPSWKTISVKYTEWDRRSRSSPLHGTMIRTSFWSPSLSCYDAPFLCNSILKSAFMFENTVLGRKTPHR